MTSDLMQTPGLTGFLGRLLTAFATVIAGLSAGPTIASAAGLAPGQAVPQTASALLDETQGFQIQIGPGGGISGSFGGGRGKIDRSDGPGRNPSPGRDRPYGKIGPGITIGPSVRLPDIKVRPKLDPDRGPSRVACIGGRATGASCACPGGRDPVRLSGKVYRCAGPGNGDGKPDKVDIACAGGTVRKGACVCGRGETRVQIDRNRFRCVDGRPSEDVAELVCRGGRTQSGRCICPRGERRIEIGRNAFRCGSDVADGDGKADLVCRGGTVRNGECVCPRLQRLVALGKAAFRCLPAPLIAIPLPLPGDPPSRDVAPPRGSGAQPPSIRRDPPRPARAPTPAVTVADIAEFVPDEVLVSVPLGSPESVDTDIAASFGVELIERQPLGLVGARIVRYRIPDGRSVPSVIVAMTADTRLSAPQPNYLYHQLGERTPTIGTDTLEMQYALAKLAALEAQAIASGKGTLVAVIDSGIDADHDDLDRSVADRLDTVALDPRSGTTGAAGELTESHGTAVAGIIAAHGQARGIAPSAGLLDVRAFATGKPAVALGTTMRIISGLEWALARGARVVNMSFSGPRDRLMGTAIATAVSRKALIVAAAGNSGPNAPPSYPAAYDGVIAVTATDPDDALYEKANRGSYVAIAAPGVEIFVPALDNGHQIQSGTSFSAAYVSGALTLLLEREPELSVEDARTALVAGAQDLGTPGRDDLFGAGRVNVLASLKSRMARSLGTVARK